MHPRCNRCIRSRMTAESTILATRGIPGNDRDSASVANYFSLAKNSRTLNQDYYVTRCLKNKNMRYMIRFKHNISNFGYIKKNIYILITAVQLFVCCHCQNNIITFQHCNWKVNEIYSRIIYLQYFSNFSSMRITYN